MVYTVYFTVSFAAGNGAGTENNLPIDNVNYSGLVNNRFTLPICAVDALGKHIFYSEPGATLIVCASSKGTGLPGITTTDITGKLGFNRDNNFSNDFNNSDYTNKFSGTSASTPIVSGVVALILEANPSLGYRDVRKILSISAQKK